jgi:hypothetical protein
MTLECGDGNVIKRRRAGTVFGWICGVRILRLGIVS